MPDHSIEEAATLHLQANQVRRSWHLRYSETPDSLDRVHLVWKGVGKMGEVVHANEELSSIPAYSHFIPTQSTKVRACLQAPDCRYMAALALLCDHDHLMTTMQKGLSMCHPNWHATAATVACNLCNMLQARLVACMSILTIRRMGVCEWDAKLYWTGAAAACDLRYSASAPHGLHIDGPPDMLAIAEHKWVLRGPIINHVRIYLACGTAKDTG